ncbi:MAG: haloacid dehalogenase type II [Beijerinckiaceae bacterium]
MIRAVAFDAYGTLFDVYSVGALAEELFPGRGAELAALWRDKQIEYTRLRTLCGHYADFWRVTADALGFCCEQLGLDLRDQYQARLMNQYACLAAYPENVSALHRMKDMGLPLAILSNGTRTMLESAVAAAGMENLFEHILSVDQVRKFKTAPEAYQLAPNAFGCPADEILFVSSNGWDACGAAWFGYTTFWINRGGRPRERLGVAPTATGRTMHDVADFLAKTKQGRAPAFPDGSIRKIP